jgi:hypothetical protein
MNDVSQMMDRQAAWQKTRAKLSWPEKMKQAEVLRDACKKLRVSNTAKPLGPGQSVKDPGQAACLRQTAGMASSRRKVEK